MDYRPIREVLLESPSRETISSPISIIQQGTKVRATADLFHIPAYGRNEDEAVDRLYKAVLYSIQRSGAFPWAFQERPILDKHYLSWNFRQNLKPSSSPSPDGFIYGAGVLLDLNFGTPLLDDILYQASKSNSSDISGEYAVWNFDSNVAYCLRVPPHPEAYSLRWISADYTGLHVLGQTFEDKVSIPNGFHYFSGKRALVDKFVESVESVSKNIPTLFSGIPINLLGDRYNLMLQSFVFKN